MEALKKILSELDDRHTSKLHKEIVDLFQEAGLKMEMISTNVPV